MPIPSKNGSNARWNGAVTIHPPTAIAATDSQRRRPSPTGQYHRWSPARTSRAMLTNVGGIDHGLAAQQTPKRTASAVVSCHRGPRLPASSATNRARTATGIANRWGWRSPCQKVKSGNSVMVSMICRDECQRSISANVCPSNSWRTASGVPAKRPKKATSRPLRWLPPIRRPTAHSSTATNPPARPTTRL